MFRIHSDRVRIDKCSRCPRNISGATVYFVGKKLPVKEGEKKYIYTIGATLNPSMVKWDILHPEIWFIIYSIKLNELKQHIFLWDAIFAKITNFFFLLSGLQLYSGYLKSLINYTNKREMRRDQLKYSIRKRQLKRDKQIVISSLYSPLSSVNKEKDRICWRKGATHPSHPELHEKVKEKKFYPAHLLLSRRSMSPEAGSIAHPEAKPAAVSSL